MPDVVSSAAFYAEIAKLHETINVRFDNLDTKLINRLDAHERDDRILANRVLIIEESRKNEEKFESRIDASSKRRIALISSFTSATIAILLWILNTFIVHKL